MKKESAQQSGSRGGNITKQKLGTAHYKRIARKRWKAWYRTHPKKK